jgi:hypothetical protein
MGGLLIGVGSRVWYYLSRVTARSGEGKGIVGRNGDGRA